MYSGVIVRCILAASTLEGGKTAAKSVMAAAASGAANKVPCTTKKGRAILVGMLCPTGTWAILNGVILEDRYFRRAALMNLVVSPGPNRFRDGAFVFG
jgi:hypothetical protein